jgi:hypothetical protein
MLIQNTHDHPNTAAMSAPSGGPATIDPPITVPDMPNAQARREPG